MKDYILLQIIKPGDRILEGECVTYEVKNFDDIGFHKMIYQNMKYPI